MSPAPSTQGQPAFVLVRPQMGENVGAAARAMWNWRLDRMRVVGPRDGWPNPRAVALASGAGRLLDGAVVTDTVAEAVADRHWIVATTARDRALTKPVLDPEAAMAEAARRIGNGQKVAVLFGPERAGLEKEDVALAHAIVAAPTNPDFPSLNLAQAVVLMAYEWHRASRGMEGARMEMGGTEFAVEAERAALADHYEQALDRAGFFFPEGKAPSMKLALRNLWSRMPLTRTDAQILHGVMRQMVRWKERGD